MMKKLSIMTAICLSLLSFSSCGTSNDTDHAGSGKSAPIEVVFWTPFTGPDGAYIQQIADEFNQSQDKYKISHEVYPGDTYYDKIKTSLAEGAGPDIAAIHAEQIPSLDNAKAIREISSEHLSTLGLSADDFSERPFQAGGYDNKQFSLPLDAHPLVLYYNKDLVDGVNVKVPTSYEELISEGKKVTKDDIYGFAYSATWPTQMIFRSIMLQNGEEVVDETGLKSNVNNETGRLAYQKLRDLHDVHGIAPAVLEQDGPVSMFKSGELAFAIDGIWWIAGFKEAGLNFGVAPANTLFGDTPAIWGGSHQIAYINHSDISAEKQEAMDEFVKYIYANIIHWAEGGQIPAYKAVLETEEFKALDYLPDLASALDSVVLSQNTIVWPDLFSPIEANIAAALTDEKTIEEALAEIETVGNQKAEQTQKTAGQ